MSKEIQLKYKGNKCSACGLSVKEMLDRWGTFKRMTEFHHVEEDKKAVNYNALIRRKLCTEQLDELDKCILLCSNCHKLIHAQNIKANLDVKLEFEGNVYNQKIVGWVIMDFREKKMRIYTDQKYLLHLYQIRIGDEQAKVIVGVELDSGDFFSNLFKGLRNYKKFEIRNAQNTKVLMQGTYLGSNEIELKQAVEFPFLEYEWDEDGVKSWARNGKLLDENGRFIGEGTLTTKMELI
ncbi:hypothetical protein [Shewanella sp. 10N.286.52.B9]|uniref:hypothetical protein n=1 Tax=Shewanella sp. 10N.286.52.B9 TaxID=1880837 RepID=UPI000C8615A4|nr:hypothetical protein [Shewanella sp. 10N.286.52.B9]PMG48687.1 hypothetical protein BCU91_18705 [Shewanella sp. 10N.286.52.B9]